VDDIAAWFLWLYKATGIKLTIFYDPYDRTRFVEGFYTTLKLSVYCLVLSVVLGAFAAWLAGSRIAAVRRAAFGVRLRFQIAHCECAFLFRCFRLAGFVRHGRI